MSTTDTTRSEFTRGLRVLADILDDNPGLPLPYDGHKSDLNWIVSSDPEHQRTTAALFARLVPGTIVKSPRGEALDLTGSIGGLKVCFIASRDAVCERVVVGTREVTVEAAPAVPATPEHTETIEDVEWVCGSLLAAGTGAAEQVPA